MPSMSKTRSDTGRPVILARSSAASSRSSTARGSPRPVSELFEREPSSRARCSACDTAALTYSAAACRNSVSSVPSGESPGAVAAHSSPQTSPSTMTGTPSSELRPPLRSHSAMNGTSFGSSAHDRYGSPFSRSVSTAGKCSNGYSSSVGKRTSPSASVPTLTSTCRVERSKSARAIETADAPSAARAPRPPSRGSASGHRQQPRRGKRRKGGQAPDRGPSRVQGADRRSLHYGSPSARTRSH